MTLEIKANVIDIQNDIPRKSDIFLVDTNVWLWQSYENAGFTAKPYQINDYPEYLDKAREQGATLSYSVLTLAELASVIERIERDIYNQSNGLSLKPKDYRHNYPNERAKVVKKVESVWTQIESIAISADRKTGRKPLASRHGVKPVAA